MYGMSLDRTRTKQIRNVDGNLMKCSGFVSFEATYGSRTTHVLALVMPTLQSKVILSWRTLQRLGVISEEFPMCTSLVVKKMSIRIPPIQLLPPTSNVDTLDKSFNSKSQKYAKGDKE